MSEARFGLNIGTRNIGISSIAEGEILSEKNVIAVKDEKYIVGFGDAAYEMYERAPENIEVIFPVVDSVISDLDMMQAILENMYKKLNYGKMIRNSEFLIAVPTDTTEVEKRAFHELVANSKIRPRSITVVEKSVADGIDCGFDPKSPRGNIVVNIGADTTDITVISLGGIVMCKTLKIAGNKFDEQIVNAVKRHEGKLIGLKSAEQLKIKLADLSENPETKELQLFGRVMASGLPSRFTITSDVVTDAIRDSVEIIIEDTKRVLEKTPPELAADIIDTGIFVTGGSANLRNLADYFHRLTGLKIHLVDDPGNSTIRGVSKILSNPEFDCVRYYPEEKVYN